MMETTLLEYEDMVRLRKALLYYATAVRDADAVEYAALVKFLPQEPCYLIAKSEVDDGFVG